MLRVIGIIVVLLIAILLAVLTCKSKSSDLFKWVGIFIFVAVALTWVIPGGSISAGEFTESGMSRLGFGDATTLLYYAIQFCNTTLLFLFAVAGFYGVLSHTKGYQSIVKSLGQKVQGREIITTILTILVFVVVTSFSKSTLTMVMFAPFVISILLNGKFDKLTAMGITFGSILVGTLAATYGTDGLFYYNYYMGTDITTGLGYRAIIGGIALAAFIGYNIIRVIKVVRKNTNDDLNADLFLEETESNTKGKSKTEVVSKKWPIVVIFVFLAILVLVGSIDWSTNFGLEFFNDLHTSLTSLKIGEDFTLISYLMGQSAVALGSYEISTFVVTLLVLSVFVGLFNGMKISEFGEAYASGFKKFLKPVTLYVLSYIVFIVCYMSPITAWINSALSPDKFNPFVTTLSGIITSIFHADLGYTGYSIGTIVTSLYADNLNVAHTLYVATYGLVQLFMPTSSLLLVGLAYFNIDYKKWFKYIWLYALIMLVVILIVATVGTYWI